MDKFNTLSNTFEQKGKTFVIGLIIWNIILTIALALGALVTLGKFSRMKREFSVGVEEDFEKLWGVFEVTLADIKNLQTSFENLQKTSQYDSSTLAGSMEQIENRIAQIIETQEGLRQDVNLLLRVDKEHPVLAPTNKGGRPRKEPV